MLNANVASAIYIHMNQENTVPKRWAALVNAICNALYTYIPRQDGPLAELYARISLKVHRTINRFNRLHALWRAGKLPTPKIRKPRASKPRETQPIPNGWSWIDRYAIIGDLRRDFAWFISTPELQQFAAAVPQAARMIRPVCRMMGVTPLPTPAPVKRAPRATPTSRRPRREWPKHPPKPDICLAVHGITYEELVRRNRRWTERQARHERRLQIIEAYFRRPLKWRVREV